VLTHLPPGADRAKARALAAERFGGEVDLAAQGSVFAIGPGGVSRVTERR
jgi:hypothetical protein